MSKNMLRQRPHMRSGQMCRSKSAPSDQRLHVCDRCNKSFTYKVTLMIHLRLHSSKKPYKCLVCRKRFFLQSILSLHLRTHTSVKRHNDRLEAKSYVGKSKLQRRKEQQRSEDICDRCEKLSKLNSNVDKRAQMDKNECRIRKKSFPRKSHSIVHKRAQ